MSGFMSAAQTVDSDENERSSGTSSIVDVNLLEKAVQLQMKAFRVMKMIPSTTKRRTKRCRERGGDPFGLPTSPPRAICTRKTGPLSAPVFMRKECGDEDSRLAEPRAS